MHTCIYIHIHMHAHTHACMHIYLHGCTHTHTHTLTLTLIQPSEFDDAAPNRGVWYCMQLLLSFDNTSYTVTPMTFHISCSSKHSLALRALVFWSAILVCYASEHASRGLSPPSAPDTVTLMPPHVTNSPEGPVALCTPDGLMGSTVASWQDGPSLPLLLPQT